MVAVPRPNYEPELIQRYGGAGPRYTSYPTAVQFHEDFSAVRWLEAIADSNRLPIPPDLSVYVHVPFCASPCFYCGCNRVITRSPLVGKRFLVSLEREIALLAPHFDADRQLRQVHLGGGTPTYLDCDQLDELLKLVSKYFRLADDAEVGLEVDPRTVAPGDIGRLAGMGFNRLSIGIQDFDQAVQKAVNREQDNARIAGLIGAARAVGFASISVDLIYGLPLQTARSFARTIEAVIELRPDRISLFNYAHMPHMFKAQRQIDESQLPAPEEKIRIFRASMHSLLDAGYEFIGMDHFALPEDSLVRAKREGSLVRNFQGYATGGDLDLIGLGPSAISKVNDAFAQNRRDLEGWEIDLAEDRLPIWRGLICSIDDRLRAEIIGRIMCDNRLDFREVERHYELSFRRYFADELRALEPLADDGLIEWTATGFQVTPSGLLFLRAIASRFDAYLGQDGSSRPRFSRIV